jgi:hypothetical protein
MVHDRSVAAFFEAGDEHYRVSSSSAETIFAAWSVLSERRRATPGAETMIGWLERRRERQHFDISLADEQHDNVESRVFLGLLASELAIELARKPSDPVLALPDHEPFYRTHWIGAMEFIHRGLGEHARTPSPASLVSSAWRHAIDHHLLAHVARRLRAERE